MCNNWYVIPDFSFGNIEDHVEIFNLLKYNDRKIAFRKDNVDFNSMDDEWQKEIIEDNFDNYLSSILYIGSETKEQKIKESIKEIFIERYGETLENREIINEESVSLKQLLNVFSDIDVGILDRIKMVISDILNSDTELSSIYNKERLIFTTTSNCSFENAYINNDLEEEIEIHEWYEIKNEDELRKVIENNTLYNAIITNNTNDFKKFSYYFNFIENIKFVLAINDTIGDSKDIIKAHFLKKNKNDYEILSYSKSLVI